MTKRLLFAILALAAAAPVAGQEWLVNRERFRYIGTRLTIDVVSEAPGRVHVIRGQDGWVSVAGRSPQGFAAAGLTSDGHLTLSAASAAPVDYMVTVPEGVWIMLRLPDRAMAEAIGGHTRVKTVEWGQTAVASQPAPAWTPPVPMTDGLHPELFTTYTAHVAPLSVNLPELMAIRSFTVRTGADAFRVATSRPLSLEQGSTQRLEIRPAGEPMDIVIDVPAGTPAFALNVAGAPALTIQGGSVSPTCGPLTRQWLSGGREWVTFTPVQGRLECATPPSPRHKG